uniref:ST3 beta-galactoside alpha-2,3-sialyltransferase 1 n=1 Tax=Amphilophus citrinellus TaxID=61819 RepID=A0A3Q0RTP3_AMPCI
MAMYFRLGKSRVRILPLLTITGIVLVSTLLWDLSGYSLCHRESSHCACYKCLTDSDPWFNGVIGEAPKPFLSRKYKLSEDDFNWWKVKYEKSTILTPIADVAEPSPDRCRSCAVVGNSGNLKGSRYGALIDFHDIVIRINYGRTKGYETDVGAKTTHRVMYPESATKLDNTTHLLFFPFKTHDFQWLYKSFHCLFIAEINVFRLKKGYYPSTGFLTVVLSFLMCDEVNIFGFGADSEGNWSHYFGILRNKQIKTGAHPGQYEYEMIEKLHKRKKIIFFKGW